MIGLDDGTIKRYDWRMAGKHLGTVYGAHGSKAVMDLKWKPADDSVGGGGAGWLASAGANKIVQVRLTSSFPCAHLADRQTG